MKYLALLLLILAPCLNAADVTITWTAPTLYEDDTPIGAGELTQYNIYLDGVFDGSVPATQTTASRSGLPVGDACFTVTAVAVGDLESVVSNEFCVTITPASPPKAPTIMDIQVTLEQ